MVENGNGGKRLSWMKPMWCYRRIQDYTEYKALLEGIRTVYVNPARTSRKPPNGKKIKFINYRFLQLGEVVTSRDVVASWNLALKGLKRMRGSRVKWSPDSPRNEAVKTRDKETFKNNYSYTQIITSGKPWFYKVYTTLFKGVSKATCCIRDLIEVDVEDLFEISKFGEVSTCRVSSTISTYIDYVSALTIEG